MKKKELKEKYERDFAKIRTLLNNSDPCAVIIDGEPEDEYDSLTDKILSGLYNKQPRAEIIKSILVEAVANHTGINYERFGEPSTKKFEASLETLLDAIEKEVTN